MRRVGKFTVFFKFPEVGTPVPKQVVGFWNFSLNLLHKVLFLVEVCVFKEMRSV